MNSFERIVGHMSEEDSIRPQDGAQSQSAIEAALDRLERAQRAQYRCCDQIEEVADGLPEEVDTQLCGSVLTFLRTDMPRNHRIQEMALFPLLCRRATPADNIEIHVEQWSIEHIVDESFAEELYDPLEVLSRGRPPENPEMCGYMLRGFFETHRRHLHWKMHLMLPLARRCLTPPDLAQLDLAIRCLA